MIPYGRQEISDKDIESVVKVLKSDFITQGPITIEFEKKVGARNINEKTNPHFIEYILHLNYT